MSLGETLLSVRGGVTVVLSSFSLSRPTSPLLIYKNKMQVDQEEQKNQGDSQKENEDKKSETEEMEVGEFPPPFPSG